MVGRDSYDGDEDGIGIERYLESTNQRSCIKRRGIIILLLQYPYTQYELDRVRFPLREGSISLNASLVYASNHSTLIQEEETLHKGKINSALRLFLRLKRCCLFDAVRYK